MRKTMIMTQPNLEAGHIQRRPHFRHSLQIQPIDLSVNPALKASCHISLPPTMPMLIALLLILPLLLPRQLRPFHHQLPHRDTREPNLLKTQHKQPCTMIIACQTIAAHQLHTRNDRHQLRGPGLGLRKRMVLMAGTAWRIHPCLKALYFWTNPWCYALVKALKQTCLQWSFINVDTALSYIPALLAAQIGIFHRMISRSLFFVVVSVISHKL
mmetsp:Transcript_5855/g.11992  ORF Transcript_5855/g.11992 Transcript_5855/m.11992 type:complete len:213 (-) Transcript_5855:539-1177(-)